MSERERVRTILHYVTSSAAWVSPSKMWRRELLDLLSPCNTRTYWSLIGKCILLPPAALDWRIPRRMASTRRPSSPVDDP